MFNACKWQLGIVDWSLWNPTHTILKDQKDKIIKGIPCEIEPDAIDVLHDGEIVYIVSSYLKKYNISGASCSILLFSCWVPGRKKYLDILSTCVHPIVSESDAIEMELKFNVKLADIV